MDFDLASRTILLTVAGSRAYGIHTPSSDVDVKGVAVPPARYFHGFQRKFEQADAASEVAVFLDALSPEERAVASRTKLEGSIYEIRKFIGLAAESNPNILDVLFCRDDEVRVITPLGRRLRDARSLFVSARAKHTFSGYAAAQLKRIRGHRAWLLSPPTAPPVRADFGLPENTTIPADQRAAAEAAIRDRVAAWNLGVDSLTDAEKIALEGRITAMFAELWAGNDPETVRWLAGARLLGLDANLIHILQQERAFEAASRGWKQYQTWKTQRNADRAALEAKHGYDTKHGGHLFRLLRMCREILETGEVHVWRGPSGPDDAAEIRAIRDGAWDYERLVGWAEAEDRALQAILDGGKAKVPLAPDRDAIDRLCVDLVEAALSAGSAGLR
jgi:predicted nucleotidyltransferase